MKYLLLLLIPASMFAQISGAGNLGCSGTVQSLAAITSSTSTGVFGTLAANTPAPFLAIQFDQTTTITGGAVTIQETYDGSNWITVPAAQLTTGAGGAIANPYTLVASTNQSFLVALNGASGVRLNLTSAITGSGSVTAYYYPVCSLPAWGAATSNYGTLRAAWWAETRGSTASGRPCWSTWLAIRPAREEPRLK